MIKYLAKASVLIGILGASFSAQSAWFGDYRYAERSQMVPNFLGQLVPPQNWNIAGFDGRENNKDVDMYFCTDATSRRVPGKLIDGFCYVEHNKKEWKNDKFYLLEKKLNQFPQITYEDKTQITTGNFDYIIQNGVTGGAIDNGYYSYHCIIEIYNGNKTLGKYIPSNERCYYGFNGAHSKHINDPTANLFVPTVD